MKKYILHSVMVLVMITSVSCLSQPSELVLDKQNPAKQNAVLSFEGGFVVNKWNGVNIMDDLYGKGWWTWGDVILTFPSGNNSVTFNTAFSFWDARYEISGIELEYFFEAGRKYQIKGRRNTTSSTTAELFIEMYDVTRRSTLLREWKIGDVNKRR